MSRHPICELGTLAQVSCEDWLRVCSRGPGLAATHSRPWAQERFISFSSALSPWGRSHPGQSSSGASGPSGSELWAAGNALLQVERRVWIPPGEGASIHPTSSPSADPALSPVEPSRGWSLGPFTATRRVPAPYGLGVLLPPADFPSPARVLYMGP